MPEKLVALHIMAEDIMRVLERADSFRTCLVVLSTVLDEYAMKHGISVDELESEMDKVIKAMKDCHEELGW